MRSWLDAEAALAAAEAAVGMIPWVRAAEVLDLRYLVPLDTAAITASVRRTNRVLIFHEAWRRGGFGAEPASTVADLAFDAPAAPVVRVGVRATPTPFSPSLADAYPPSAQSVAARRLF